MAETWPACALGLLALAAAAVLSRRLSQSWLSPGAFFAGLWLVACAAPVLGAPEEQVWPEAVWLLVLFVAVFCTAALLAERRTLEREPAGPVSPPRPAPGPLRFMLLAGCALGLGAVAALMAGQEHPLSDLLRPEAWVEVGARYAVGRYEQNLDEPLAARLLSVGFYFAAIAGGALWVASRRALDRAAAILPLLVALAHSTLTTARAVLLFALSMWAASAFASLVVARRPIARIRPLTLLGGAMAAAALVAVSTGMQLARGGADDLTTPQEAFSHLGTWLFGHLPGFGAWLRDGFDPGAPLQMGRRTFGGAFQLLGLAERERGVFADFARLSSGRETNIYTALRGLIEDFGLAGGLLSAAIAGWASGVTYAQALRGRPGRQVALALAYCFILWTPIVSFFSYNTLLVAFALAVPALHPWAQEGGPHADAADLRPLPL